jgi:hypothetical protein
MTTHLRWRSPILMNENKLWDFTLTSQQCKGFLKVYINRYWDRLSILFVSHGSLTFFWLKKFDLHNIFLPPTLPLFLLHLHLGQLCWCKGEDIFNIYGIMDLWVMGKRFGCGGTRAFWCYTTFYITIISFALNLRC